MGARGSGRVWLRPILVCIVMLVLFLWLAVHYQLSNSRSPSAFELHKQLFVTEQQYESEIKVLKLRASSLEGDLEASVARYRSLERSRAELKARPTLPIDPEALRRSAFLALGSCSAGEAQSCRATLEFASAPPRSGIGATASIDVVMRNKLTKALELNVDGDLGDLKPSSSDTFVQPLDENAIGVCTAKFHKKISVLDQLKSFASSVKSRGIKRRIAYTVVDKNYKKGIADIALNYERACDVESFLFVTTYVSVKI